MQIFVIDSADRRRMEETGLELQQLLEEVFRFIDGTNNYLFIIRLRLYVCSGKTSWSSPSSLRKQTGSSQLIERC